MKYPNDEDGNVLQQLFDMGVDMSAPLNIEFAVAAENEQSANSILQSVKNTGYDAEVYYDEGELEDGELPTEENKEFWPSWSVYVEIQMIPEYDEIIRIQKELDETSKPLGGHSDGWGVTQ